MNLFDGVNYYILHHSTLRDGLQIACSGFMDVLFLLTAGYWALYSRTSRLIIVITVFYAVRFLVQQMFYSPFPAGYWWYYPGFPSLIIPYGRGSDFFFSGHIGFVTICASEWVRNGKFGMVLFSIIGGIYTAFVLITYQVHYSIDIFTGIFFAHYSHLMVDAYKDTIDNFIVKIYISSKTYIQSKKSQPDDKQALMA